MLPAWCCNKEGYTSYSRETRTYVAVGLKLRWILCVSFPAIPGSRPPNAGPPLLVKEMNCELSDDRRVREQPLSVVQRFRGRSNPPMSLRSLGGQLCFLVRVPYQTYRVLSAMSLAQRFHFAFLGGLQARARGSARSNWSGFS